MSTVKRRIVVVTAHYPYGQAEPFLEDELSALASEVDLTVAPVNWWRRQRRDWVPPEIQDIAVGSPMQFRTWVNLVALLLRPRVAMRVFRLLCHDPRHLIKNALVVPTAASLAAHIRKTGAQHIHAHWLSTSGTVGLLASELTSVPFSITAHRWDILDGNLAAIKGSRAAFVRFISSAGRMEYLERYSPPARAVVLRMGVRLPAETPDLDEGPLRLVYPASFIGRKGHLDAFLAFKALQESGLEFTVDLVGSGPMERELRRQLRDLALENRVRILGQMHHEDLLASYASGKWNALVLASHHEGIPISIMEAMSFGLPVIATSVAGVPELVRDGIDGLLVPPSSPDRLQVALATVAKDVTLRKSLGANARGRIREQFAVRMVAQEMAGLIGHEHDFAQTRPT